MNLSSNRAKSSIKLLVATVAIMSASIVGAGNRNTCYQNYTSCSQFSIKQCAGSAIPATDVSGNWQPCNINGSTCVPLNRSYTTEETCTLGVNTTTPTE